MSMPTNPYEAFVEQVIHDDHGSLLQQPQLHNRLTEAINQMIIHQFDGLIQLLYRLDVSEQRLKELLQQHAGSDAAAIIAQLIIERQQQKMITRAMFKNDADIAEDDRW